MILQTATVLLYNNMQAPAEVFETGKLLYGNANPESEAFNSQADFCRAGNKLEIRIAWYLIGVKNPRTRACIAPLNGDEIKYSAFDAIKIGAGQSGKIKLYDTGFKGIEKVSYKQRLKKSYKAIAKEFLSMDNCPLPRAAGRLLIN